MCGIAGLWRLDGARPAPGEIEAFTDTLAHRGPDGRGVWVDPEAGAALGHRRLAILDLSPTGAQPMSHASGRYWITFNGEIYNFLELRAELESLGDRFVSGSDTEVILAAYARWGEDCQLRFNGMWAFAIWDREKRTFFLSRDRFGVKPLHYFLERGLFAFASELKSFLRLPGGAPPIDERVAAYMLAEYGRSYGTQWCLLRGVKSLRGGHSLTVGPEGQARVRRWWRTAEHLAQNVPIDLKGQAEEFRRLFFDACRIRMRSDVPLGTALSGGLDSSSVLCSMAAVRAADASPRLASDWQRAFVATFPGTPLNEKSYAEQAVSKAGASAVYLPIDPNKALDEISQIVFDYEDFGQVPIHAWLLYRGLRGSGVFVSMDGHGGDELLAGYYNSVEAEMWSSLWPIPHLARYRDSRSIWRGLASEGASYAIPSAGTLARRELAKKLESWPAAQRAVRAVSRNLRSPDNRWIFDWLRIRGRMPEPFDDDPAPEGADALDRRLYEDFHHEILPLGLRNFDRCSMAHGVEIRAPFMDWRLVCYAFALPSSSKLGGGTTKRVLREAMRGVLPEPIRTRASKIGFASPLKDWLRGPLKSFVLDTVHGRDWRESSIWDGQASSEFVEKAVRENRIDAVQRAWPMVQAVILFEEFKKHAAKR